MSFRERNYTRNTLFCYFHEVARRTRASCTLFIVRAPYLLHVEFATCATSWTKSNNGLRVWFRSRNDTPCFHPYSVHVLPSVLKTCMWLVSGNSPLSFHVQFIISNSRKPSKLIVSKIANLQSRFSLNAVFLICAHLCHFVKLWICIFMARVTFSTTCFCINKQNYCSKFSEMVEHG